MPSSAVTTTVIVVSPTGSATRWTDNSSRALGGVISTVARSSAGTAYTLTAVTPCTTDPVYESVSGSNGPTMPNTTRASSDASDDRSLAATVSVALPIAVPSSDAVTVAVSAPSDSASSTAENVADADDASAASVSVAGESV